MLLLFVNFTSLTVGPGNIFKISLIDRHPGFESICASFTLRGAYPLYTYDMSFGSYVCFNNNINFKILIIMFAIENAEKKLYKKRIVFLESFLFKDKNSYFIKTDICYSFSLPTFCKSFQYNTFFCWLINLSLFYQ